MSLSPPYLASPVQAQLPLELERLYQRSQLHLSDTDKRLAVDLLAEAYCDLVDACFSQMLAKINERYQSPDLVEAQHIVDEIKGNARHYLRWLAKFIANDRLLPVIRHFRDLVVTNPQAGGSPFLALGLSLQLAADSERVLAALKNGTATDIHEGIELLIQVIDEVMIPLVILPKDLMKFSFIVDKTLNGVIGLVRTLFKRMLRKLGPKLPPESFGLVAEHLGAFVVV